MGTVESEKRIEQEKQPQHQFGFFLHGYQPPREIFLPTGRKLDVVSFVNEDIYNECYGPILVEGEDFPGAATFSFYGTLREWMRGHHPEEFAKIRSKLARQEEREYKFLGDPYLHPILPLLSEEDQESLVRIGKQAFIEDLGFAPKGFWLPEAAASSLTLRVLERNGYEFVVLNENQLKSCGENPMYVPLGNERSIAVFHYNADLSQKTAFNKSMTVNGDFFLDTVNKQNGHGAILAMDLETIGHWQEGRVPFLAYVAEDSTLSRHALSPLRVKEDLSQRPRHYTGIKENSSWSCEHSLGRWTGECSCDNPSEKAQQDKRHFFRKLSHYQERINANLDEIDPLWSEGFEEMFLSVRHDLFTGRDITSQLQALVPDERTRKLFLAKTMTLIGLTSCGWFFGADDRPEREIPKTMIDEVEKLI